TQTGGINLTGPITAHPGYDTLRLLTNNAIVDSNSTEPDIAVTNLFLRAATGISAELAGTNLGFSNTSANPVILSNTGALTIANVANSGSSSNNGATTTLTATGALTFAANTSCAGILNIDAAGASQSAGAISCTTLLVLGTGLFTLNQSTNSIGTVAAL